MNKRLLFLSMLSMIPAALYGMQKHKKKDFKKFSALAHKEQFSYFEYPYCINTIKQEPIQPCMYPVYYYKAPIAKKANKGINTTPNIVGARFYRNPNTYYKPQIPKIISAQQPLNNQINTLQQVSAMAMQYQIPAISAQSINQHKNNNCQENRNNTTNKKIEKIVFNTPNMLENVARIKTQKNAPSLQQNCPPGLQYLEQYDYPMNVYYYYATEEYQENNCKFNTSL